MLHPLCATSIEKYKAFLLKSMFPIQISPQFGGEQSAYPENCSQDETSDIFNERKLVAALHSQVTKSF